MGRRVTYSHQLNECSLILTFSCLLGSFRNLRLCYTLHGLSCIEPIRQVSSISLTKQPIFGELGKVPEHSRNRQCLLRRWWRSHKSANIDWHTVSANVFQGKSWQSPSSRFNLRVRFSLRSPWDAAIIIFSCFGGKVQAKIRTWF